MTLKKVSVIAAAVASAMLSGGAAAAEVDYHGYMRAGMGFNSNGGSQVCYGNGGPSAHVVGRLGDECDMYGEFILNANKLYENQGNSFNAHTLLAFGTAEDGGPIQRDTRGSSFQGIGDPDSPWSGQRASFREAWVDYTMEDGMSLWAGKRYYGRKDVHILDMYYVNTSGDGVGVENIKLGEGNFSAAVFNRKWKAPLETKDDPSTPEDETKNLESTQLYTTVPTLDLRYGGLNVNENGSLDFTLLVSKPFYTDAQKDAIENGTGNAADHDSYGLEQTGYNLTVEHTQGDFFGGFNKFVVQYSTEGYAWDSYGINSHMGIGYNIETQQEGRKTLRIIDWGVIAGETWDMGYSFVYSQLDNPGSSKKGKRYNAVVRPSYKWSETMSTVVEAGYYVQDDPWMTESQDLSKITLAQQWQAGKSFWARPAIRVFASMYNGDYAIEKNDMMVGAQIEAWW
ncbi:carbohydrate porin [Vibrio sp. SCSIO 43136]|uniref:carbohydrate porin n=1 Tax=Vibrio sp. SCSIO 43136 TaxID=2819101 RepID=UPI0020764640|nr:carbohydrate porin [Vibrio sp. SCSIO 43136]USD67628.1 carbohydrate porin [Vibrio sp. SCSIO 43136]